MKDIVAVVLAAGEGKRMKFGHQKVLCTLYGRTMVDYVLGFVASIGIKRSIVVIGYKSDVVEGYLRQSREGVDPQISIETAIQKETLGTGHAVIQTKELFTDFKGDILVLYGDTPLLRPQTLEKLIATHRENNASCTLLTTYLKDPTGYGRIVRDTKGAITKIVEEKDASPVEKKIEEINVGAYCFRSRDLFKALENVTPTNRQGEYYLTDTVGILAHEHLNVCSVSTNDLEEIVGINSAVDLQEARRMVRKRILNKHISNGVTIVDFETTYIDDDVHIGPGTIIYPHTVIEREVEIGRECEIGPFARLRPGTVLENRVEVGTFVELVRSKVGEGSKIKHHSYIGDALIGKKVNIGTGTITATHDDQRRYITEVGDNASIGAGTILIAPVKVGSGATAGAGSIIAKGRDIPAGAVVAGIAAKISRSQERNHEYIQVDTNTL